MHDGYTSLKQILLSGMIEGKSARSLHDQKVAAWHVCMSLAANQDEQLSCSKGGQPLAIRIFETMPCQLAEFAS